jgi:hypothetical protein
LEEINEEVLESIFEWFAANDIVKGDPSQLFEKERLTEISLKSVKIINNVGLAASKLLKRRKALKVES